jgi:hypothetical protein
MRDWIPSWLTRDRIHRIALAMAVVLMVVRAIRIFIEYSDQPLDWDALGYRWLAHIMRHPYDTLSREPAWIGVVWLSDQLFGHAEESLRVMGTLLFFATAAFFHHLARDLSGSRVAALIAFILFTNHWYMRQLAVRGLRDNLEVLGVVALAYFLFARPRWLTDRLRLVGWVVAGVLLPGTRLSLLTPLVPLFALGTWRNRIRWWKGALALAATLALMAPYLVYSYSRFGDPIYATNLHAAHWRNVEFVRIRGVGCPGCPTLAAMGPPSFQLGEPTTAARYVFGMHSMGELVVGTAAGFFELLVWPGHLNLMHARPVSIARIILCWVGIVLLICQRRGWVLLVPVLSLNVMGYLATMHEDARFFVDVIPFQIMAAAIGATWLAERVIEQLWGQLARRVGTPSVAT